MTLSLVTLAVSAVGLAVGLFAALKPEAFKAFGEAYPRSVWPGRVLTALLIPWAVYALVQDPPFAGNPKWIKLVVVAVPVAIVLIVLYLDELLSARAVGGLFMLTAEPILTTSHFHPSPWTLVIKVFAYVLVVAGMVLVVSPFRLRHVLERWTATPERIRSIAWTGVVFFAGLAVLGLTAYQG